MIKARPSIAVSSPASLETLYFRFNYSLCRLPPLSHPHCSSWLPTGRPTWLPPLLFTWSFFPFAFVAQNQLGEGVERGGGRRWNLGWFGGGGTPRFHVCSSGVMGVGELYRRGCSLQALQTDPPIASQAHRFWQDQGPAQTGVGEEHFGRLVMGEERHWLLKSSPQI